MISSIRYLWNQLIKVGSITLIRIISQPLTLHNYSVMIASPVMVEMVMIVSYPFRQTVMEVSPSGGVFQSGFDELGDDLGVGFHDSVLYSLFDEQIITHSAKFVKYLDS